MKEKEYTLKDAVKMFYDNENVIELECIRNEKDLSEEILEMDMGKGDRFHLVFNSFIFWIQDLTFYKVTILRNKKGKPNGFEFFPNKREYYKFVFKV